MRSTGTGDPRRYVPGLPQDGASGTDWKWNRCGSGDEDIEPDDGSPVPIEQPTSIVTKPLSEKDQDDRVRMALGLTHDDPLPEVSRKTLLAYYRYLAANLKFPFNTSFQEKMY